MAARVISGGRVCRALTFLSCQGHKFSEQANLVENKKTAFPVDMLGQVRRGEEQDVPSKKVEVITSATTEVRNDSLENTSQSYVSDQKENYYSLLEEIEMLKTNAEWTRERFRALDELNKLSAEANERVAKNAEAVKLIERTDKLTDYMFELDAKYSQFCALVDRVFFKQMKDINDLEEQKLKAARNDVLKICLGTLVSVCAGGLLLSELASHF